jgi:hypothetical protein
MSARKWVEAANGKLAGTKVRLEMSGKNQNISVRGTFPPMPWNEGDGSKGEPL